MQNTHLLFNRREAKDRLHIGQRKLDGDLAAGKIGCVRLGGRVLFREVDLETYIARHACPAREMSGAI